MGILDDAIREHLDLKRRLGAEEDEIQRLEGEAFGPPTRPGDPDFPEDEATEGVQVAEPFTGEAVEAAASAEAPRAETIAEPTPPEPPSEEAVGGEGFYDHAEAELDLDLELDLNDDEIKLEDTGEEDALPEAAPPEAEVPEPEVPGTEEQPAVEPEPPSKEAPIESLDTVEHHFEGATEDTGEGEVVEGEIAEESEGEEEDEDVLEETPEFLRDAPEDDELWFEQGEPKDFDF